MCFAAAFAAPVALSHDFPEEHVRLFNRMVSGIKCREVPNNGKRCEYRIAKLAFSIKDVGGNDTVVAFIHSDIRDGLYAVIYMSCVAVIPSKEEAMKHDRNFGVYISPVTGEAYMTPNLCRAAGGKP
jgi:hypothetical protein